MTTPMSTSSTQWPRMTRTIRSQAIMTICRSAENIGAEDRPMNIMAKASPVAVMRFSQVSAKT